MEVTREVVLPAPQEEVWDALTNPDRLAEWFANDVELEATPGGDGRFRWDSGEARRAVVERIDEQRELALRWWDEQVPGDETLVTITLEEAEEGTRVVVTESAPAAVACAGEWGLALELYFTFSLPESRV